MNREEFKHFILSIGFKYNDSGYYGYYYKNYRINLYTDCYDLCDGSGWVGYDYNDLSPLEKEFKKELRSIKLKKILG